MIKIPVDKPLDFLTYIVIALLLGLMVAGLVKFLGD